MNDVIILNDNLLINEGATRKCYRHPLDSTKCLKVAKNNSAVNEQDLQAYQRVQPLLRNHIAGYEDRLADTNLGKALVCELIRDDEGNPSASFAEYRRSNDSVEENLASQFAHFFDKISRENLFFYDLNPKNFIIQRTSEGTRLIYTDLKSLGKTRTLVALEKIPFFAKTKLRRRISRFKRRFLHSAK